MRTRLRASMLWQLGWAGIVLTGALVIVRFDIAQRREKFQTDARIAHGVLSLRAIEHEAVLATLMLLGREHRSEQRLPAPFPHVIAVARRGAGDAWPDPALAAAERRSQETRRAAPGAIDAPNGQYTLVLAGEPSSYALRIDARRMIDAGEWPLAQMPQTRAVLELAGAAIVLQPGAPAEARPAGITAGFTFEKPLSAPSQPFVLRLSQATGPAQWPWPQLIAWAAFASVALAAGAVWLRGRRERRRAEELLRVGQAARLNTMGEFAAAIAHELNQPLAAILTNAQAAQRLLDDDDPAERTSARNAMAQAASQARRAADVVGRLRRLIESPAAAQPEPVHLRSVLHHVLDLIEPELRRRGIETTVQGEVPAVLADPVALEQIVHNLIRNAMQALDEVPASERRLHLSCMTQDDRGMLIVRDSGPGIATNALTRVFEPFYTTRSGGLGLGLSLCESLAHTMQATLEARNAEARGAQFVLSLPLAKVPA